MVLLETKRDVEQPDGAQADYSNPLWPLFLPTIGSRWGDDQDKMAFYRLEKTGYEGILERIERSIKENIF